MIGTAMFKYLMSENNCIISNNRQLPINYNIFFSFSANIKTLILSLTDTQLANFCRILAVAISDLDIYENKSSCK